MGKQVNELDALSEFTDDCVVPTHNGVGLKKGTIGALTEYLGTKFSNPNLLINPDFAINQRDKSSYSEEKGSRTYTVDRWGGTRFTVTPESSGIIISADKSASAWFSQKLETATPEGFTVSCYVESISGSAKLRSTGVEKPLAKGLNIAHSSRSTSEVAFDLEAGTTIKLNWVKLEVGQKYTLYVKPLIAEELLKCKRYFRKLGVIFPCIFIPNSIYNVRIADEDVFYSRNLKGSLYIGALDCSIFGLNFMFNTQVKELHYIENTKMIQIVLDSKPNAITSTSGVNIQFSQNAISYDCEIY